MRRAADTVSLPLRGRASLGAEAAAREVGRPAPANPARAGHRGGQLHIAAAGPSRADWLLASWLQSHLQRAFASYAARYRDVHGRNVLIELRPRDMPGVLCPTIDHAGRLRLARVGLQPIDMR